MKQIPIKREANIGSNIELSNIELVVLKTKLNAFVKTMLDEHGVVKRRIKISEEHIMDVLNVITFLSKLTNDVVSLQEANKELFGADLTNEPLEGAKPLIVGKIELHE